jgi:hypothetical protein
MQLTDNDLAVFDRKVLKLPEDDRQAYMRQVDYLIERLTAKIKDDASFGVRKFLKAGSLRKRTVLKPRDGFGVDADIAVYLKVGDEFNLDSLHDTIRALLMAIYPQKLPEDFQVQPRTLGIEFHESGLDVDLVPVIPLDDGPGDYGLQPSSRGVPPIKTSIPGQLNFIQQRVNGDQYYRMLVRILKYWRNRQELDDSLRSFAIELIAAHLQDTQGPATSLEEGLIRFFLFIAQTQFRTPIAFAEHGPKPRFPNDPVVILDPVNGDNNVTRRITVDEREVIVSKAIKAWEKLNSAQWKTTKGETLACWRAIFGRAFTIEE